jgi:hypothetical protein
MKIPMIGKRFGRLTVIADAGNTKTGMKMWECKCDCGNITVVRGTHLREGSIKSCGCIRREETSRRFATHRKKNTRIYRTWRNMKTRCYNPKCKYFKDYGGRGIAICEEWMNSFESFFAYVSQLPHFGEEGRSIDRINNNGNYEPGNVRWATAKEQRANQRKAV